MNRVIDFSVKLNPYHTILLGRDIEYEYQKQKKEWDARDWNVFHKFLLDPEVT